MLQGKLTFRDADIGEVEYTLYGQDSFDSLKLYLVNEFKMDVANYSNANLLYDKAIIPFNRSLWSEKVDIEEAWERLSKEPRYTKDGSAYIASPYEHLRPADNRRLDIKKNNKCQTNVTNKDFASRVSAIIRYATTYAMSNYNQNATQEDYFNTDRIVNIPDLGVVKYSTGLITELVVSSPYVDIVLHQGPDDIFESPVFGKLERKDNYGNLKSITPILNIAFKMDGDMLGIPYTPPAERQSLNVFGMYETIEDVIEAHPDKNTSWILDRDYHIVTDDNLEEVMEIFNSYDGYIAFDTETTGLDINFRSREGLADELVGVVLSWRKGEGYYFPLQHKAFQNLCNGDHWYFMEKYMKTLLETKKIVCHNLSYDWKVAYIYGIVTNCVYDTQLAFGVTKRYEDSSFALGLKSLTKVIFGLDSFDLSDFVTGSVFGKSDIRFDDLPYELVRQYAPADTDMTLSLFEYLEHHDIINKYGAREIFDMEVNFAKVVAYSEFYGYRVAVENVPTIADELLTAVDKHKKAMFDIVGREFNPSSAPQLQHILYTELGIPPKDTKMSTKKEILKEFQSEEDENGNPRYPFIAHLLGYRDNEKLYSGFIKKLDQYATPDGFIFPNVYQLGTDTGRTTAKDPNYQSYNNPIKKNIIPRSGFVHFDCDFSQIEYRVLASMAKQESLIAEFDDADLDYHTYQASRMFSIPYSLVSKDLRGQSKGINFGLPYGMGDSSLGARIFGERSDATRHKATALRRKFFAGQEKIEMFFSRVRDEGVRNNFTSTYFGRRRYYNRAKFNEGAIRRQAGNHVIQGTAADIYKKSVNRMFNRCVAEGWLGLVMFNVFVHDELLMEVSERINMYYFMKAWREEFELKIDGFCPLYAGAGVGGSWYEAKSQDLPPQYISDIIDQYHPEMEWHGDMNKFLVEINNGYEDYKNRRVREFITAPENQGEIIKPLIYALLVEMTGKIIKGYQTSPESHRLITALNNNLPSGEQLIPLDGKHKIKTLKDYLSVFTYHHGLDLEKINMLSADEAKVDTDDDSIGDEELTFESDTLSIADMLGFRGYHLDPVSNCLFLTNKPMTYNGVPTDILNYLHSQGLFKEQGTYQIALYDEATKETILYEAYLQAKDYKIVMDTYAMLVNANRVLSPMRW